jgi:hypothetical protein
MCELNKAVNRILEVAVVVVEEDQAVDLYYKQMEVGDFQQKPI